ncbi:protein of unknown function DUF6 transmembrane [Denitrovibrio acetiphilus DSM 12809]|uniref:EamA domain-containing protein n=1 Tax=Denitrovibrio acetiphilus (strain DSM 12809 / NBRC 114555 / N2460) TaxID=522772 RepID=D4H1A8_DENA2|nr:DMT family transporter [Denitrovibrio acetiphilus]ADD66856.1 protein of unknown function DUF6 transmembrane [Denitrovibrio acetiphilus DSM 12809]
MSNALLYLLLTLGMVSWGESWISAKLLTGVASPDVLVFWRFFITWLTFIPVMIIMKKPFAISRKGLIVAAVASLLLVLYNQMFFTGLVTGFAGAGGILVTTLVPILTFGIGCVLTMKAPSVKDAAGLLLGLAGAAIIMEVWKLDIHLIFASGNAYFLVAALTWAFLTHTSKRANRYTSAYTFSFYLFLFTALFDLILLYSKGMSISVAANHVFVINMFLITVGATTFGTTIYFIATNSLGSQKASSFIFLVPLNALLMSYIFLDEPIRLNTVVGGLAAITAVYLINYRKRVRPAA